MNDYACAILVDGGRLLLGLRAAHRRAYPGCWDVIGGKVEPGETITAALVRELGEEVGVVPTEFHHAASLDDADARGAGVATYHFFVVTQWQGGPPAICNHEHSDLRWFTVEEACALPNLAIPDYPALFRGLGLA